MISSLVRRDLPLTVLAFTLALGIGLLAAWPYLTNAGLPADTDAELHVYRTAELGYSVRAGNLYPRWAPSFFHGYGYPIFNYYAPLTYHLGHWLTLGHPERAAAGARGVLILAQVVGALGAYRMGKLFGGRGGGLLGALCFSGSPYILLINPHIRGDLPESFALAALPWALWAWELVWRRGTAFAVFAAVSATSTVFLSHNLTGLTVVALVAGLGLWRLVVGGAHGTVSSSWAAQENPKGRGRLRVCLALHPNLGRAVLAAVIFVLITAFFWLPFLAERRYIQLDVAGDGHYDFRNHFVPPARLVAPLRPIDRRTSAPDVPMTAGLAPLVVAIAGAVIAIVLRRWRDVGFYAVAGGLLLWMVTPSSQALWEALPGIEFFQFPWRFLGPIAVLLVPLASCLALVERQATGGMLGLTRLSRLRTGAAAAFLLIGALPGLYPVPWEAGFGFITPEAILEAELAGRWRGTTSTNDFVPETVEMIPGPQAELLDSYARPPVDRVNRHTLPDGASVRVVPSAPWVNAFIVRSDVAFTLRLYLFAFPGWRAYIDGQPAAIELAHPEGFITIPVPAGDHDVVVRFESTRSRRWAWALSGLGLASLGLVVAWPFGDREIRDRQPGGGTPVGGTADVLAMVQVAVVLGTFLVVKTLVLDPAGTYVIATPLGQVPSDVNGQRAHLGGEIELIGFDLSPQTVAAGDVLEVKLVWRATRPVSATYQSFAHLVYPEGKIVGQSDHLNPGGFPTNLWPLDRYVVDRHQVRVPIDAVPGVYLVSAGLFSLDTGVRVPVDLATCGQRSDTIVLCDTVVVER